ncbi:MAG: F0F1 ATP synthase subunit delta [Jatrophihabitantaceae bacterium]
MRSASRAAAKVLREVKRPALERQESVDALTALASELYAIADLLVAQPRLRRTVGHSSTPVEGRVQLIEGLLRGRTGDSALEITVAAVRARWSSPWDLTDALEGAGDDALFAAAERNGELQIVEDELFWFERILNSESDLLTLLDEPAVDASRRIELLDRVIGGKVHPVTNELLRHGVVSERKRSITLTIDDLLDEAAARRSESTARVLSAIELDGPQLTRLTSALSNLYGRQMTVRTATDATVRGGLVIRVGNEVIDGSVAERLVSARAAVAR